MKKLHLYFEHQDHFQNGLHEQFIDRISFATDTGKRVTRSVKNLYEKSFDQTENELWVRATGEEFYFYPFSFVYPFEKYGYVDRHTGYKHVRIPERVIDDCVAKRAAILVYDTWEGDPWWHYNEYITHICMNNRHLRPEHFLVVSGNLKQPTNIPYKHVGLLWFQSIFQESFDTELLEFMVLKEKPRENKFIMMSRRPAEHRLAMLYNLWDFLDQGVASFSIENDLWELIRDNTPNYLKKYDPEKMQKILDHLPLRIRGDANADELNPVKDHVPVKFYNSHLHIVPETFYRGEDNPEQMFFSEKTFKPIQAFQPFVLINYPNSLGTLRQYGYETFSEWIDESYDIPEHINDRIAAASSAVIEFINHSPKELAAIHKEMYPVLKHNHNQRIENVKKMNETLGEQLLDAFHSAP